MDRPKKHSISSLMRWCKPDTLLALLIAASFIGISSAQENPDRSKNTFAAIALTDLPYEHLYYRNGQKATNIELRNGRRSNPYPLSSSQFFELYTDPEDPDDPEKKYQLIGKTSALIGARKTLYFFRDNGSAKEGTLPVELYGIDDSETKFPEGSFRFINFMNVPLTIQFDGNRFEIKPNESMVRKLKLSEAGSFTPFVVTDTEGRTLGGTRLFSHATNREMVLIFPPKKGKKRLDIRYFSD